MTNGRIVSGGDDSQAAANDCRRIVWAGYAIILTVAWSKAMSERPVMTVSGDFATVVTEAWR